MSIDKGAAQTYGYKHTWGQTKQVDAETAAMELENIRRQSGILTAEVVVASAEREDSPLHEVFDWDDSRAAHEWRLRQARNLIKSVVVRTATRPQQTVYVHVKGGTTGQYLPLAVVVNEPDLYREALDEAREFLSRAQITMDEILALGPQPKSKHVQKASTNIASAVRELEKETTQVIDRPIKARSTKAAVAAA